MGRTKLQKILSTTAILGAFIVVGTLILMMTGALKSSRAIVDFLIIVGIICFGCISCMTVARYIHDKTKIIPVYLVFGLTGLTCVLWIIFIFIGQSFIDAASAGTLTDASFAGLLTFAKIVVFVTIQTSLVNLVISNLFKLKKTMLVFQVIMYASNAFVDFWLSAVVFSVIINGDGNLDFAWPELVTSRAWISLFVVALAYTFIAGAVMKRYEKNIATENALYGNQTSSIAYDNAMKEKEQEKEQEKALANDVETRLRKLDDLKAKGLISDEDYEAKKAKILEDI